LSVDISPPSPAASSPPRSPWLVAADLFDPPADADRDEAEACTARLGTFIRHAWPIVEPATPYVASWHVDTICEHLEAVSAGELHRLIINVPPRTMKSLSVAVFWPAWEWLRKPWLRWLFASYAEVLSQRDSMKMRRLIKSEGGRQDGTIFQRIGYQGVLAHLEDEPWQLTRDQDAKTRYETTATGMRLATSTAAPARAPSSPAPSTSPAAKPTVMGSPLDVEPHVAILECIRIAAGEVRYASRADRRARARRRGRPGRHHHRTFRRREAVAAARPDTGRPRCTSGSLPATRRWTGSSTTARSRSPPASRNAASSSPNQQGALLAQAIRGILAELGVADRPEVPAVVRRHLTVIAGHAA
jgi:hypothetical protein